MQALMRLALMRLKKFTACKL